MMINKLKKWVTASNPFLYLTYNYVMPTTKQTGIVIKMLDFNEKDSIVSILSHDEIISFIALGVRTIASKNRVALQLGNIVEVEFFKARLTNKLSKLKKAILIKQPPIEFGDTALVILEILKYLQKIDSSSEILFNRIIEGFAFFGEEFNHHIKTFILFGLLDVIGHMPIVNECVECKRKDRIKGFDLFKGGFTCSLHTEEPKELEYLKAISDLTKSMNIYKNVNPLINKNIFEDLIIYLKQNMYT